MDNRTRSVGDPANTRGDLARHAARASIPTVRQEKAVLWLSPEAVRVLSASVAQVQNQEQGPTRPA
jgi:hypothetical protein